jgi:hypothetical protein
MTQEIELDGLGDPIPPFRWSFSQWETYNTCPQKWKFQSILKLPRQPPGPAAARGLDMHDRVEHYIMGQIDVEQCVTGDPTKLFGDKRPAKVDRKYIPILDQFRNHSGGIRWTEHKMAFDVGWYLCDAKSKHASTICVLDAVRVGAAYWDKADEHAGYCSIGEWKSGKPKDTHADQRSLYAMFGWKAWPHKIVQVTTYYLEDTAPPQRLTLKTEEGFENLKAKWQGRIEEMQRNDICAPKPGWHCNYCDFSKRAGGPCQFGG